MLLPKTGISSSTSSITRPDKNCPGKNKRFELSNKMRNFINFRDIFYGSVFFFFDFFFQEEFQRFNKLVTQPLLTIQLLLLQFHAALFNFRFFDTKQKEKDLLAWS